MENVNYTFFEEFKRLEALCNDVFGVSGSGVTVYVDHMKLLPASYSSQFSTWDTDLKTLIRLRHYRNKLAHGTPFDSILATQEDIEWLLEFYDRILKQQDPLAQVEKERQQILRQKLVKQPHHTSYTQPQAESSHQSCLLIAVVTLAILFVIVLCICFSQM